MTHLHRLLAAALTICTAISASAEYFGYCTDVVNRANIFRLGSDEGQGMAINLDNKMAPLKDCSITGVSVLLGSSRTTDGNIEIFLMEGRAGKVVRSTTVKAPTALKWADLSFDEPYVITGNEERLWIGYRANINVKSSMLMSDHTRDSRGPSYIYADGAWHDARGLGVGNASVRAIVDKAPSFTDMMLKIVPFDAYFKAATPYSLETQVYNFGTEPITSFDVHTEMEGGERATVSYSGLALGHGECLDIQLPAIESLTEGEVPVTITIDNVNGSEDADVYHPDNILFGRPFFYPANMERSILLEGFTGQTCHNCPTGHATIESFLETATTTPVIEVMHHAGYSPDFMTMRTDVDYTFYYGSGSTYAPAVMLNRTVFPTLSSVPVMEVSANALTTAYQTLEQTQPYVSLGLETTYNPKTRLVNVTTTVKKHRDLPGTSVFNLMLVQDGIISMQTPYGSSYTHNAVFRGTITKNSWGKQFDSSAFLSPKITHITSFTLPESIFADYYDYDSMSDKERAAYTFPADVDNMYIVAYVASYDKDDPTRHTVYNAVSVPVGQSYVQAGLSALPSISDEAAELAIKVIDGRVMVDGGCDSLNVYDLEGRMVDASSRLTRGIYIVRAAHGHNTTIKKVIIR